jgi:hypothetical protein
VPCTLQFGRTLTAGRRSADIVNKRLQSAALPDSATLVALHALDPDGSLRLVVWCAIGHTARLLHSLAVALATGSPLADFDTPLDELGRWFQICRRSLPVDLDLFVRSLRELMSWLKRVQIYIDLIGALHLNALAILAEADASLAHDKIAASQARLEGALLAFLQITAVRLSALLGAYIHPLPVQRLRHQDTDLIDRHGLATGSNAPVCRCPIQLCIGRRPGVPSRSLLVRHHACRQLTAKACNRFQSCLDPLRDSYPEAASDLMLASGLAVPRSLSSFGPLGASSRIRPDEGDVAMEDWVVFETVLR